MCVTCLSTQIYLEQMICSGVLCEVVNMNVCPRSRSHRLRKGSNWLVFTLARQWPEGGFEGRWICLTDIPGIPYSATSPFHFLRKSPGEHLQQARLPYNILIYIQLATSQSTESTLLGSASRSPLPSFMYVPDRIGTTTRTDHANRLFLHESCESVPVEEYWKLILFLH